MKLVVLITRPQPEADEFADAVQRLGYATLCEPLLTIETFSPEIEDGYAALIATSPQALSAALPTHLPLFVMGVASLEKARGLGFKTIFSADGDFGALVSLVRGNVSASSRVLYLRGDVTRHEMGPALAEYSITERIVYRARPRENLSPETVAALKEGRVQIVTSFSPRTAALFQNLVQNEGLGGRMAGIKLLCLSPAVLDSSAAFTWAQTGVAPSADSAGMLAVLRKWIGSF